MKINISELHFTHKKISVSTFTAGKWDLKYLRRKRYNYRQRVVFAKQLCSCISDTL